ncbi:hypothetical protein LOTGIDRAFT_190068 [Lottia gigantea]|uniref:Inorganic pyrophosphatase n=1 Tax=Lottia gigantea TaxID=225164 RepID=V3ZPT5_LOTGI|nr:hypothetical protein LOTGIDRAFT_190068 [Lottia gigantea]ESO93388.1 hypothetical protein LOTGIDRAFT_190068 [Lottia gigantea]
MASVYSVEQRGQSNSLNYRLFFKDQKGKIVSPWHDIPLRVPGTDNVFNMIVEIPRWTNAKMEICKEEKLNPIKQDIKKGNLRFVKNIFPHHGYIWNYGALPQTFEDPTWMTESDHGKTKGDQDPLDVCEIGSKVHARASVIQVKVLGVMLLVDEGETDWKIIAIDVNDPKADMVNDIGDVKKVFPGLLSATHEWFKYYKVPDGKPENIFGWNGEAKNKAKALEEIQCAHVQWTKLIQEPNSFGFKCENTNTPGSNMIENEEARKIVDEIPPASEGPQISSSVDVVHYVIPSGEV